MRDLDLTTSERMNMQIIKETVEHIEALPERGTPPSPQRNTATIWLSTDGDLNVTINHEGAVKTAVIVDFSEV